MKTRYILSLLPLLILTACVQPNPNPNGPAYVADTNKIQQVSDKVSGYVDKAQAANAMSAPINPYAVPVATGLETVKTIGLGVTSLATLISGLVAFIKSKTAGNRKAALVTLARANTNEEAILNANSHAEAAELAAAHHEATPISTSATQ